MSQYARMLVPMDGPTLDKTTYLRLGYYTSTEDNLKTGLKITTSTISESQSTYSRSFEVPVIDPVTGRQQIDPATGQPMTQTQTVTYTGAEANAEKAEDNAKKDPAKRQTATSQQTKDYSAAQSDLNPQPSNKGILLYTEFDLNENVKGSALQKFGKGHHVEVTTADAKYNIKAGRWDVFAKNGIFLKAGKMTGDKDDQGNTLPAEQQYVVADGDHANLEITATGYIKQTAYGDLDEWTYGTTTKKFDGESYDWFKGKKETHFEGEEHTYKMSGSMSFTLSGTLNLKFGTDFSLTGGVDVGIRLAFDFKVFIGGKIDVVLIADVKLVAGKSAKICAGLDSKVAGSDAKILATTDMKVAPTGDFKICGANVTICNFKIDKELIDVNDQEMSARKTAMKTKFDSLVAGQTSIAEMKMASLKGLL